jgi:hypothetical protein
MTLSQPEDVEPNTKVASSEPLSTWSQKLGQVYVKLIPFQSLEFDPATGIVIIMTKWQVPHHEHHQLSTILEQLGADEQLKVKRFPNHYKIVLTKRIRL